MSTMDKAMVRKDIISKARRVVVKVGSAVLTDEHGVIPEVIDSLAGQISALHSRGVQIAFVSSGAVAAGRSVLKHNALCNGQPLHHMPERQAASAIGQSRLMHAYDQAFAEHDKVTAQVLLTKDDFQSPRQFLNACNTLDSLFSFDVIPVVNENDTVVVQELEFGDNDRLACLLLNMVEADLLVNLTSAMGVFTANPDSNPEAKAISVIDDIDSLDINAMCGGKTTVGSGGMYSKLMSARRAAQRGVPTLILSGKEPDALLRAFSGEDLGTWVQATGKCISRRKFRMAYNTEPSGTLVVDAGAARALTQRGKSLLPIGITGVQGVFDRGELVRIVTPENEMLGVGVCNYEAGDLKKILGVRSSEIEEVLGYGYNEAVHRDNLLLGAAL